ncbi:MAG: hypothetical protein HPY79_12285 [Bacteroidales bacterium]|nr:hypothetical protein [Bacteroidales bacterium]
MKKTIVNIIVLCFMLPELLVSQQYHSLSFTVSKFTTKTFLAQKYKPEYKYFRNYKDIIGSVLRYNYLYHNRFEIGPALEFHLIENNVTGLNGYKCDISIYNGYKIYEYKNWYFHFNVGTGISLFKIYNSKKSAYYFTHIYRGFLINPEIDIRYKIYNNILLIFNLTNSFYIISNNDKYKDELNIIDKDGNIVSKKNLSQINNFSYLKLGILYHFTKKK